MILDHLMCILVIDISRWVLVHLGDVLDSKMIKPIGYQYNILERIPDMLRSGNISLHNYYVQTTQTLIK